VPEDDLKQRVSSIGCASNMSMKNFEAQLDDMLFNDRAGGNMGSGRNNNNNNAQTGDLV